MKTKGKECIRVKFPELHNLIVLFFIFHDQDEYISYRQSFHESRNDNGMSSAATMMRVGKGGWSREISVAINKSGIGNDRLMSTVAHESIHVVQFINEVCGFNDDEFDAYTLGYIISTVTQLPSLKKAHF